MLGMFRLPAGAQQAGKTYRVGILTGRTPAYDRPLVAAFRHTLSGLGYQEGAFDQHAVVNRAQHDAIAVTKI